MKLKFLQTLFVLVVTFLTLTSCYRMPHDDEFSVIPATNNPDVVKDRGGPSWMPGASF